jgi:type II secretory pathway component PulF
MAAPDNASAHSGPPEARSKHERAHTSAAFALSLAELLRAGAKTPRALTAMAARHRQQRDPDAPVFERIAIAVREEGRTLAEAVRTERTFFTSRFVAALTLANLGGQLFRVFVQRLREYVPLFQAASPSAELDFPVMHNETSEFCFFFGHLILERASQPEVHLWLPRMFSPQLRLPATHLLGRFYDQGLLLSQAFARTSPFNDPEMVLAIRVGEELNKVGRELLTLANWLLEREKLEERMRMTDWVLPGSPEAEPPHS